MVITARDSVFFAVVFMLLAVAGVAAFVLRRRVATLLTRAEWIILLKLVAIAALVLLLVLMNVALELPSEMFIYGRF